MTKPGRTCARCRRVLDESAFHLKSTATGLLNSWCKQCNTEDRRQRGVADPERSRELKRLWRLRNREHCNAYNRQWAAMHPEEARANRAKSRRQSPIPPEKKRAHDALRRAVARGTVTRAPCEVCGAEPAQAHHKDYSRPLEVRWLCRRHHEAIHRKYDAEALA